MLYDEFLKQVRDQAGVAQLDETERVVNATLTTLQMCLARGGTDALPAEVRRLVGPEGVSALNQAGTSAEESSNPQFVGQNRIESGGESTPESGQ